MNRESLHETLNFYWIYLFYVSCFTAVYFFNK